MLKIMKRTVFIISDGTGLTASDLGHSLLTQFPEIAFEYVALPYVNSIEKINSAVEQINQVFEQEKERPIVFTTLIKPEIRQILLQSAGVILDFFMPFIPLLEREFQQPATSKVGQAHGLINYTTYQARIDAVNYALSCDDGIGHNHYGEADLILLGVSRSGKTPTCLYMALEFGIFIANYPLTEEVLSSQKLPQTLESHRYKLFGLMIDEFRLHQIRSERKKNSRYASLSCCQSELKASLQLFKREKIAYIDTTSHSIEEIATSIMAISGIKQRRF